MIAALAQPRAEPAVDRDAGADIVAQGWVDADTVAGIVDASPFLTGLMTRDPDRFATIATTAPDETLRAAIDTLEADIAAATDEAAAMTALRAYRQVLSLTTALADLTGMWDLEEVTNALADGADAALQSALDFTLRHIHKVPEADPELHQGYVLIAMGKHGARELNYSSDIDIIAVFDPDIARAPDGKEMTPHFVRVTQMVAKLLQSHTADGYVFRVDLRLRPDPGATPVAMTIAGALNYYEALGQNWERAAMIKARPAAGDLRFGDKYLRALKPFIWRKHLDFAAIADIHAMKRQIHAVKGFGAIAVEGHNIKLGRGGIREIEFFVQTQQLIAGGRAPNLRVPETLAGLNVLAEGGWIATQTRDDMAAAYRFLRSVENRLQMLRDEQTHTLPDELDGLAGLARFCGFDGRNAFATALTTTLETVQRHYEALFAGEKDLAGGQGSLVFTGVDPDPETVATLAQMGFSQPEHVWQSFAGWHQGRVPAMRSPRSRELLTELTPALFDAVCETGSADAAFAAFERFLAQLPAGVQLFSMLQANPKLLALLMAILGTAPRLAKSLVRRPSLFGAVLDPRFFGEVPDRAVIAQALDASLDEAVSYEELLDTARLVGQDQAFLIGVRQLTGNLSVDAASGAYSALAELLIDKLLARAWDELRTIHGDVPGGAVSVLAMGKLGSAQMTAGSDLDLILIYDHDADATGSSGERPLAPTQYFSRLTQRLIAALSAQTANGNLYEVDMRLRPSGRSGPVATRIDSFDTYQHQDAWVWEHMALTRARPVAGDPALGARLEATIADVLRQPRDADDTREAIVDMRRKVAEGKVANSFWDLKLAAGGLVDIEFIAQGLQLIHAADNPDVLARSTKAAIAALSDAGVLAADDGQTLTEALALYDAIAHRVAVCIEGDLDPETAPAGLRARLTEAAALPDFERLGAYIQESQVKVREIFERGLGPVSAPETGRPGAGNP